MLWRAGVVTAALAPLLATTTAWAYWSTSGTGSGPASVTTLTAPSGVVATAGTRGVVNVSWSGAVAPDGTNVSRYSVQRFTGASPADACATTPALPLTAPPNSCSDAGLPDGTYTYKVTAVFRSWTAASSASVSVGVLPDAPASVSLANGGGTGAAYINAANSSAVSVGVGVNVRSLASDTVTLTVHDAGSVHTLTRTATALAGAGTVVVTGLNLAGFTDGTITMTATATDAGARISSSISSTAIKDVVAPATSATCNGTACPPTHTYVLQSVGVVISATDTGGTGVASVSYTLDGVPTTVTGNSASFTVSSVVASHTVSYFATDLAGNAGTASSFSFSVIL